MKYVYNALITKQNDHYEVSFPQFDDLFTHGSTREEALVNAVDLLTLEISDRTEEGKPLPPFAHTTELVSISLSVSEEDVEKTKYMTMAEAQEYLHLSASHVSALAQSGKLESRYFGRNHMVSIDSVERFASSSRKPGLPAKGKE